MESQDNDFFFDGRGARPPAFSGGNSVGFPAHEQSQPALLKMMEHLEKIGAFEPG